MGSQLKKTSGMFRSASGDAARALYKIDPRFLRMRLTPPARGSDLPPAKRTGAQLAVEAQNRGLGGNFRQPIHELVMATGKYKK